MKFKADKWRGVGNVRYAHAKLDGHWIRVFKNRDGVVIAETSNPTDITTKLPARLLANVQRLCPAPCELFGELYAPGKPASSVKTAINDGTCRIQYFAVGNHRAAAPLEEVQDLVNSWGLPFAYYEKLSDAWDAAALLERFLVMGYEGAVLKYGNMNEWYKLKANHPVDLIVTGVEPGKGKYYGQVGALICSTTEGIEIANVSGMTDEVRREITRDSPIGRVVEVKYQYVGAQGRLRHPVFSRWRDDKTHEECSIDQVR